MSKIYRQENGKVQSLKRIKYDQEADLQNLIAENPDLIQRSDDAEQGIRYYLVQQEMSFPESEFSLDHLMLSSDGVPTLVEVKRSSDTRIRREVVAQMIEYAAHAKLWTVEKLKELFDKENQASVPWNGFWNTVEKNLNEEYYRLVFAADEIPQELRFLMEFLNRTIPNMEIYGVEITPFTDANSAKILSVNTIETATKVAQKRESKQWDESTFVEFLRANNMEKEADILPQFVKLAEDKGLRSVWGKGAVYPSVTFWLHDESVIWVQAHKYADGFRCPTEVAMYLERPGGVRIVDQYAKETLHNTLVWRKWKEKGKPFVWDSNQYLYIGLCGFDGADDIVDYLNRVLDIVSNHRDNG